jgi:hypothetical protein
MWVAALIFVNQLKQLELSSKHAKATKSDDLAVTFITRSFGFEADARRSSVSGQQLHRSVSAVEIQ